MSKKSEAREEIDDILKNIDYQYIELSKHIYIFCIR